MVYRRGFDYAEVKKAVKRSKSLDQCWNMLRPGEDSSSGKQRLKHYINQCEFSTDHWTGKGWNAGNFTPADEVFIVGRFRTGTNLLRLLVHYGYAERKCSWCGIKKWRGQPAPLEVDHINGNNKDNRIENLRVLCCNCHALTPTWKGRNITLSGPVAQLA